MSNRKPHILLFPSSYPTSHSPVKGVFYREQAEALRQVGLEVGVVYPDNRSLRDLGPSALLENHWQVTGQEEEGIPTVRLHGWNIPFNWLRGKMLTRQYQELFTRYVDAFGRPDLIHSHGALWGGASARTISEQTGIPFVHTEHTSGYARDLFCAWEINKVSDILSGSEAVISVSKFLSKSIKSRVGVEDVRVIPNMVDTSYFTIPSASRNGNPFIFLTVAILNSNKGIDTLVKSFCREWKGQKGVRLEIGGTGPCESELKDLVGKLEIEDQVFFLGRLSRKEVRERMWKANAFILPSYVETFGVVVIEAMSTGLPVIATRSGGPEEIVTNEVGWLTEPGEIEELGGAMRRAYEAGDELDKREKKIRRIVKKNYSRKEISGQLTKVYEEALEKNK